MKSKSIRKEKWSFVGVQIPLYVCGYLFNPLYVILRAMFLRPLGRYLDRKDSHKLTSDIQQSLGFLFTRYHAIIVANGVRRLPPNFGPTIVTISVENIMIRVLRGRGELNIEVAPCICPFGLARSLLNTRCNSRCSEFGTAQIPRSMGGCEGIRTKSEFIDRTF